MSFSTDCGGLALKADIKLSTQTSTWRTRLTALLRSDDEITICTFSLPKRTDYLASLFRVRSKGVTIIVNQKFEHEAKALKSIYQELCIILSPNVHAKMALASPDKVWLSSENLVKGSSFEGTVGIHSIAAYTFLMAELQKNVLQSPRISKEVAI